jgi:hypothetical protein
MVDVDRFPNSTAGCSHVHDSGLNSTQLLLANQPQFMQRTRHAWQRPCSAGLAAGVSSRTCHMVLVLFFCLCDGVDGEGVAT